ncbi:hypothetical protein NECID01_0956 [Nematocida sp. AWRm77]|nr:hypothetical protein NECID01_0956 [Nematocida sp. AWRm77]
MKGVYVEELLPSTEIVSAGWGKEPFVARRNFVEFLESGVCVHFPDSVEHAVGQDRKVYVVGEKSVSVITDEKKTEEIPLPVPIRNVRDAQIKEEHLCILLENEVLVCNTHTKAVLRYTPFGHEILSFCIGKHKEKKEACLYLLLKSKTHNLLRGLAVGKGALEEFKQVAVSHKAYKVLSAGEDSVLVVEEKRLSVTNFAGTQSMFFGNPLVRCGCVLGKNQMLLCMFGDEMCIVDTADMKVVAHFSENIVAEKAEESSSRVLIYNRDGDVGVWESPSSFRKIRESAGRAVQMKVCPQNGRDALYLLKHAKKGNIISKIDRKRPSSLSKKTQLERVPVQIVGEEEWVCAVYKDGSSEMFHRGERQNISLPRAVAHALVDSTLHFVTADGRVGSWACREESTPSVLWHTADKKTPRVFVTAAAIDEAGAVLAENTSRVAYFDLRTKTLTELVHTNVVSLSMTSTHVIVNGLEHSYSVDRSTLECSSLAVKAQQVFSLFDGKYFLVNEYTGALSLVRPKAEEKPVLLRTGPVQVQSLSISPRSGTVAVCTATKVILLSEHKERVLAEYLWGDASKGVFAFLGEERFAVYSHTDRTLCTGVLGLHSTVGEEEAVYAREMDDFVFLDSAHMVGVSQTKTSCVLSSQPPSASQMQVDMYKHQTYLSSTVYAGATLAGLASLGEKAVLACNTNEQGKLLLLQRKKAGLFEVFSVLFETECLISVFVHRKELYCVLPSRICTYVLREKKLVCVEERPTPSLSSTYKVEYGTLIDVQPTSVRVQHLGGTSTRSCPSVHARYINRARSLHREASLLDPESTSAVLVGTSVDMRGSMKVLLSKEAQFREVLDIHTSEGICAVKAGSLSLLPGHSSVFVCTVLGNVYRIVGLSEKDIETVVSSKVKKQISDVSCSLFYSLSSASFLRKSFIKPEHLPGINKEDMQTISSAISKMFS